MSKAMIKTRFAPSPTGYLHVGGLRTALFNYLFAKQNKGKFALRIEDTDQARKVEGTDKQIINVLNQFGLEFDEGPLYQSERLEIYRKHADELVEKKFAYKDEGVIRQKISKEGVVEFEDLVYGKIKVENHTLDEGVLVKSDGFPTYNFANVVDDHLSGVTHVMRGQEFVPSTPKHILLYEAFGWDVPKFVHLPLILDKQKKKLSKRTGNVSVEEYFKKGYHKEALLNFIALLGWNPKTDQEFFSLNELVKEFAVEKINKAGAIFDVEKLDFINRQWQAKLNLGDSDPFYQVVRGRFAEKFGKIDEKLFERLWPLIVERVKGPSEAEEKTPEFDFFFTAGEYESDLLLWKDTPKGKIKANLEKLYVYLEGIEFESWSLEKVEENIKQFIEEQGMKAGEGLWPLRISLSGLKNSPGPFEIIYTLSANSNGRKEVLARIKTAIEKL